MILTSGCFDGIHAGHIAFFEAIRAVTDQPIYVAVAPDAYIRAVKGCDPRFSETHRLAAVIGLKHVAEADLHGASGVESLIMDGSPWTAFVKGWDWMRRLPADIYDACEQQQIAVLFVQSGSDLHTHG